MFDQRAQIEKMLLNRLTSTRGCALPFSDEFLRGEWRGVCPFASFYSKNGHNESRYESDWRDRLHQ
jgi:hypothetical protein